MSQEKKWVQQPKGEGGGGTGDYNPTWDQSEMPIIEGTITGSRANVGKYGKTVYDLRMEDGTTYSVWGTTVLDKQLAPIPFNSFIKIQYLGKKAGKGNAYHDYDVFVAGEQAPAPVSATVQADVKDSDPALNQPLAPVAPTPVAATPAPEANAGAVPATNAAPAAEEKENDTVPF